MEENAQDKIAEALLKIDRRLAQIVGLLSSLLETEKEKTEPKGRAGRRP